MLRTILGIFTAATIMVGGPGVVGAVDIGLQWDANTEPDLGGYKLYYKADSSGPPYTGAGISYNGTITPSPIDVGNVTQVTLDAPLGFTYYFAVTAYDTVMPSLESDYSNEVSKRLIKHPPPENLTWWDMIIAFFKRLFGVTA